jgi:hypothetical protein
MSNIVDLTRCEDDAILAPMHPLAKTHKMHSSAKAVTTVDLSGCDDDDDESMPPAIPELLAANLLPGKKILPSTKPLPAKKKSLAKHMVLSLTLPALPTNFATTAAQSDEPDKQKPVPLVSATSVAARDYNSDDDIIELFSDSDDNSVGVVNDDNSVGVVNDWKPAAKLLPTTCAPNASSSSKRSAGNFLPFGLDRDRNSILVACDTRLDELTATWCLFSPDKQEQLLRFPEVVAYAKKCLRSIRPGSRKFILQLKCPVRKKNHNDEDISLALGGNCPDDMRRGICSIRCADALFGIELLSQLFVFNCRVECRIDCKSGRCAICSWIEAEALGKVYEVLCVYAHAVGAKIGFISLAGSTTGIGHKLGTNFFEKMTHVDGTPYISEGMYVPNGYHISLGGYYCNKFPTVEMQVSTLATDSTQLS